MVAARRSAASSRGYPGCPGRRRVDGVEPDCEKHQETFNAALTAFADYYGIPAPAATLRPVAKDTPVLLLHTTALTAVLSAREGVHSPAFVAATQDIVKELLGHENKYWSDTLAAHHLDQIGAGSDMRRQAVAIAGLLGADDEQQAGQVLRRLPVLADAPALTIQTIMDWLREIYPAASSSWLGSIQPDCFWSTWSHPSSATPKTSLRSPLAGLPEDRAEHALVYWPAPSTTTRARHRPAAPASRRCGSPSRTCNPPGP